MSLFFKFPFETTLIVTVSLINDLNLCFYEGEFFALLKIILEEKL